MHLLIEFTVYSLFKYSVKKYRILRQNMAEISKHTSIARIISDLIISDNVIDENEMDILGILEKDYSIHKKDFIAAQLITFSDAIETLRDAMDDAEKDYFLSQLRRIAMADGVCSEQEALLLTAVDYCLDSNHKDYSCMLKCHSSEIIANNRHFIVYIENEEDDDINAEMGDDKTMRAIVDSMRLNSFDFIYIPFIINEFKQKDKSYIYKVLRYMSPNFSDEDVENIYDKIIHTTTATFTNDLLYKKMDIKVSDTEPALLINVGSSLVPYCGEREESKVYTEFLKINIIGNVYDEINHFLETFLSFLSATVTPPVYSSRSKLNYFGLYKGLLDLMVFTESESDLRIDIRNKRDMFRFTDTNEVLRLKPNEAVIYCMIIQQTLCDKVNHGLLYQPNSRKKTQLNNMFRKIYGSMSDYDVDKDYTEGISQAVSHIRKAFKELRLLKNRDYYLPIKDEEKGIYTLKAGCEAIKVYDIKKKCEVPMILSEYWTEM